MGRITQIDRGTWRVDVEVLRAPANLALDKTSEVEIRFPPESTDWTKVELEHRRIDRHGDGWESVRDGVDNDQGGPRYLQRHTDLFNGQD